MKIRYKKTSKKDLIVRYQSKYKKLFQIKYNILNTKKIFKFNRVKWRFLNSSYFKYKLFPNRIFTQLGSEFIFCQISHKRRLRIGKTLGFKSRLKFKRCLQYWYAIKKRKILKQTFYRRYTVVEGNKYRLISKHLSLFFQFELRIDVLLKRVFYFPSLAWTQNFIKTRNILINQQLVSYPTLQLRLFDLIEIKNNRNIVLKFLKKKFKKKILYRIKVLSLLTAFHLEINHKILTFRIHKNISHISNLSNLFLFKFNFFAVGQYLKRES